MMIKKSKPEDAGYKRDYPKKGQQVFQSRKDARPVAPRPMNNSSITGNVPDIFEGIFKVGKNGIGYVTHKDSGFAVMIQPQHTLHALNGDRVSVAILNKKEGTGQISEIIKRGKIAYAGIIEKRSGDIWFIPSDNREPEMRCVPISDLAAQNLGKKVTVRLGTWIGDIPTCEIIQVIGIPGENDTEMNAIVLEKGFDEQFPERVIQEAQQLHGSGIPESEIAKRRDMRNITTFTIDPVDAKDFDDALSFNILPNGNYEIGVHIADVSFYVTKGSALDEEAKERTTSVYLVDRVIPMLPEVLSNELCSLRQDEDKLSFSSVFTIEKETGKVLETWFGRTIISSNKRFTYEEAQEIIDLAALGTEGLFSFELSELMRFSKIYTAERFKKGALSMDTDEVRFILDENGKPIRVMIKKRIDTMRMIEEWMLLANKFVAMKLSDKQSAGLAVYRIHDKPAPDRVEDLLTFLKSIGYTNIHIKNGIIPPHELQQIIDGAETDDARDTIQSSIVRSMAKAIYSTENIGHFGLAFDYYTHFTSPIRRYPDIMVHRLLQLTLDGQKVPEDEIGEYKRMCTFSSDREKDAQEAERESIKYKQVEYMTERIGKIFDGIVTGVGKFGVYVAEAESKSEGMIRLMDLGNDFFAYDEKRNCIIGKNSKQEFHFGQKLKIKVKDANLEKRLIDYTLVTESEPKQKTA